MGDLKDFTKKSLPGMAVAFGTAAIMNLLAKDTIRSAIKGRARKLFTGDSERRKQPVSAVEEYADQIVRMLEEKKYLRKRSVSMAHRAAEKAPWGEVLQNGRASIGGACI